MKFISSILGLCLWGFALYGGYTFYENGYHQTLYFAIQDVVASLKTITLEEEKIDVVKEEFDQVKAQPYFTRELRYIKSVNRKISEIDALEIIYSVNEYYKRTGLKKSDYYAILAHESGFRKNAIGYVDNNDHGIAQVNKRTYQWLVKKYDMPYEWHRMLNINYNIRLSTLLLKDYRIKVKKSFFINDHPQVDLKDFEDTILIGTYNKGIRGAKQILESRKKIRYIEHVGKYRKRFSSQKF